MKNQYGFTLIELMVVVAITATLAAIAIPIYHDYVARTQLSEAMLLADALKTPLTEAYANQSIPDFCTLPANVVTNGRYVSSLTLENASSTNCDVVVNAH